MKLIAILVVAMLSGCATQAQLYQIKKASMGYKPYDPCIRCGETWQQLPNQKYEAQIRRARGEQW
jgi:hypothetical protein